MTLLKKRHLVGILIAITVANFFLWWAVYNEEKPGKLVVAFLDIGQGDAIYIESPTHHQLLIDAGPPHKVLSELGAVMRFYDRTIDVIMVTNPDQDHIGGFMDVLNLYKVSEVIEPGTHSSSATYAELEKNIDQKHIGKIDGKRGTIIHLGGGADLHILFPDQDVSSWATNDGSIIAKLIYGSTSVMFTGDAPSKIEEYTIGLDPGKMESTILKAGHHGSRTSASESFVKAIDPRYAIISAGIRNKYGHPHKETIDLFQKLKIPVLGTYREGRIIFVSDSKEFIRK